MKLARIDILLFVVRILVIVFCFTVFMYLRTISTNVNVEEAYKHTYISEFI